VVGGAVVDEGVLGDVVVDDVVVDDVVVDDVVVDDVVVDDVVVDDVVVDEGVLGDVVVDDVVVGEGVVNSGGHCPCGSHTGPPSKVIEGGVIDGKATTVPAESCVRLSSRTVVQAANITSASDSTHQGQRAPQTRTLLNGAPSTVASADPGHDAVLLHCALPQMCLRNSVDFRNSVERTGRRPTCGRAVNAGSTACHLRRAATKSPRRFGQLQNSSVP
jgi:hypothetical protein